MATFSMSGSLQFAPSWVDGSARDSSTISASLQLANGTGSGQANAYWAETFSIAAGATQTIDLTALPQSVFGASGNLAFWKAKAVLFRNLSDRTDFTVGGAPTNRFDAITEGTLAVPAGGFIMASAPAGGFLVSSTEKTLEIENTDQTYTRTANLTQLSTTVTNVNTTDLKVGMLATGANLVPGTKIATITSGTTLTLTAAPINLLPGTTANLSLSFANPEAQLQVVVVGVLD